MYLTEVEETDVLVVGAGPTGLTLACSLRRQGITCRVVERATAFHSRSRGKGLQPRSLELLDDLGGAAQVIASGWSRDVRLRWHVRTALVADLAIPGRDPMPDTPYPNIVLLPQWRTEEVLRELLARSGGHVELGQEVVTIEQDPEGVTAVLRDAKDGAIRTVRTRYLVGCDGAHSSVRRELGVPMAGQTRSEHFVVGDVEIDGLDPDAAHVWFDGGRYLAASPFPEQRAWQVQASVQPDAGGEVEPTSLEMFQRLFRERTGRTDIRLHDATWLSAFVPNVRMVDRYRFGRVFLAGDAAHVHSPVGGQGMNMGMQDAYNLGWKLGLVLRGRTAEALLDTYEEERLPVARSVLTGTDVGFEVIFSPNRVLAAVREHVLIPMLRIPTVQRVVLSAGDQLDVGYRESRLSAEGPSPHRRRRGLPSRTGRAGHGVIARRRFARAVHAGDRAPDLALSRSETGTAARLFEMLRGPHFTLLLFTDGNDCRTGQEQHLDPLARKVEQRLGSDVRVCVLTRSRHVDHGDTAGRTFLHDPTGASHRRYGVTGEAVYLVRPDGYVGFRAPDLDDGPLLSYLDGLLTGSGDTPTAEEAHAPTAATPRRRPLADAGSLRTGTRPTQELQLRAQNPGYT